MSRIEETFRELREKGEGALIGYLTLGDPDMETSEKLVRRISKHVDILELGIPFTDPIADGPTIQAAIERSLEAGTNTDIAFRMVKSLRKSGVDVPFVFMTYYNIVLQYGEERFVRRCRETGVEGILVSDMPLEESEDLLSLCRRHGVDFIFLIAPTTTEERIKKIVKEASGFVYLVSLLGTTGARDRLQKRTLKVTRWARKYVKDKPLAVGFGISKPEHVRAVLSAGADGVVVGSAFVKLIGEKGKRAGAAIERLARELKGATKE
jgi:tryptophan synthase alpha chain